MDNFSNYSYKEDGDFLIGYDKYFIPVNKDTEDLFKAILYIEDNKNKTLIESYLQEAKVLKKIGHLWFFTVGLFFYSAGSAPKSSSSLFFIIIKKS